jgi:hypothetical protein
LAKYHFTVNWDLKAKHVFQYGISGFSGFFIDFPNFRNPVTTDFSVFQGLHGFRGLSGLPRTFRDPSPYIGVFISKGPRPINTNLAI